MRRLAILTVAIGLAFTGSLAFGQEHEGGEKKAGHYPAQGPPQKQTGLPCINSSPTSGVTDLAVGSQ